MIWPGLVLPGEIQTLRNKKRKVARGSGEWGVARADGEVCTLDSGDGLVAALA